MLDTNSVAVNLIVRNEAIRLPYLLPILSEYFSEIVVVDQESTDDTVEILRKYNCKIVFDKATGCADSSRQLAIDSSLAEWIFTIDADEFPTHKFLHEFPLLIKSSKQIDGFFHHLAHLDVPDYTFLNHVDNIVCQKYDFDHTYSSFPNRYRLFRRNRVKIDGKLHTGVKPYNNGIIQIKDYCAIIEIKTASEQQRDVERYAAVHYGQYLKDVHL